MQLVPKPRPGDIKRPVAQTSSGPRYDTRDGARVGYRRYGILHKEALGCMVGITLALIYTVSKKRVQL